ncbi:STAS domain-containing protein [Tritonibacter scottomollicae]|uniref:STAS domain-containing protein n=1 Tax=Tritonibacter scottomollicae TaxID=483013 RepID=A0ABZ0HFS6_TRISK|nr:STAS domain-containing protein [Tritonibacter scottomollicae]WOI32806.1 STAS domain-containing protein [Tritonibacter scottomollicae]
MTVTVPILRQGSALIASIQEDLCDSDILNLQSRILEDVIRYRANAVIVDVSAIGILDSFGTKTLIEIAHSVKLRGAKMIIVGIQPDVAISMVLLGLTLKNIPTALDLDHGLALIRET